MPPPRKRRPAAPVFEFLIVDEFLRDFLQARALKSAFDLRLIDELLENAPRTIEELATALRADRKGLELLVQLLAAGQVMDSVDGRLRLHARFLKALAYRDLLLAKLDFAGFVAGDVLDLFTGLIADPAGFMRRSRLFNLFDYRRALESSHENYERTRAWMRFTTTLTRYEAQACLEAHDFSRYRRMLDIGGNSGEFALQACRRHHSLRATVMDLPLVCEVGQEHVLPHEERSRIGFLAGDVRRDALPGGYDLIVFKSMLHDWPEEEASRFIAAAAGTLQPGGTLLIFERQPMDLAKTPPTFAMWPALLFFRSYRDPGFYLRALASAGLANPDASEILVDVPFCLVTAAKQP